MAGWNACLCGARYNPVIPLRDTKLSDRIIRLFGVDVLLPVVSTSATETFIKSYPHLHHHMWRECIFGDNRSEFLDIRHAAKQAARRATGAEGSFLRQLTQPIWTATDILAPLLSLT